MQSREKQYIFAGENIELINMKCHDLKHQITRIRKEMEDARKDEALKEIEDAIQIYDHVAKTGCEALDTLLTEKGLYCDSYGISLNYMVDGEILSWMKSADIYSLFGNARDNAIEAVIEEKEPEKRIITLQVFEKMSYLCIHMENYSGFAVRFEDGLPITRKKDKKYHGFGLKSMKYVVKKYKGTMTMEQKNQFFYLDILIPLTK